MKLFKQSGSEFIGSKSNWLGMIAIVTGVGAYYLGEMNFVQAVQTIGGGLMGIFVKDAVAGMKQ